MTVQLGNPNVLLDMDGIHPAIVRLVETADFSCLPEEVSWLEIGTVALAIDGYEIAESLPEIPRGKLPEWFNGKWEGYLDRGEALPSGSLHLWLMLFICQRGYLKDRWTSENEDGSPSQIARGIRDVYAAFRRAVMEEQRNPQEGFPVYLRGRQKQC